MKRNTPTWNFGRAVAVGALIWATAIGCTNPAREVEGRAAGGSTLRGADPVAATDHAIAAGVDLAATEVCAPDDIKVSTTVTRPGPGETATVGVPDAEALERSEARLDEIESLGLAPIMLCSGVVAYLDSAPNQLGCFNVYADTSRSSVLGAQRAMASMEVLHNAEFTCD